MTGTLSVKGGLPGTTARLTAWRLDFSGWTVGFTPVGWWLDWGLSHCLSGISRCTGFWWVLNTAQSTFFFLLVEETNHGFRSIGLIRLEIFPCCWFEYHHSGKTPHVQVPRCSNNIFHPTRDLMVTIDELFCVLGFVWKQATTKFSRFGYILIMYIISRY